MRIISWNIARRDEPWRTLADMDVDLALLQEAKEPPPDVAGRIEVDPAPWEIAGGYVKPQRWRAAIAKFSNRVGVQWVHSEPLPDATPSEFAVSLPGSLTAVKVTLPDADPIILLSMYSQWRYPHEMVGSSWIISDSSAHRIISDLSELIGRQGDHRIIAAGDLNILHGYGEYGSPYWAERYRSVFTRMEALGTRVLRATGAPRSAGRPLARGASQGQPKRPHLPLHPSVAHIGHSPTGLRICISRPRGKGTSPRSQHTRRVGPQ